MRLQPYFAPAVAVAQRLGVFMTLYFMIAGAHALTISPVLVELSPARRVVSISVSNPGDRPLRFQTQVLAWSQAEGIDQTEETDDLVVVPPVAEIPGGRSQIFRVTFRGPPPAHESAYRLVLEDVTEATAPAGGEMAVELRLNHSLPVFVSAPGRHSAQLRLGPCATAAPGTGCVRLDNDGGHYAQLKSLNIESGGWRKSIDGPGRVLAGAWRQWTFAVPADLSGALTVTASTQAGAVTTELRQPPR